MEILMVMLIVIMVLVGTLMVMMVMVGILMVMMIWQTFIKCLYRYCFVVHILRPFNPYNI